MSRSFGESYRVDSTRGDLAMKLFCTWDWKVTQRRSVQLLQDNLCTQLKVSPPQSLWLHAVGRQPGSSARRASSARQMGSTRARSGLCQP